MRYKNNEKPFMKPEKRGDESEVENDSQELQSESLVLSDSVETLTRPEGNLSDNIDIDVVDENTGLNAAQTAALYETVGKRTQGQSSQTNENIDRIFMNVDRALDDKDNTENSGSLDKIVRAFIDGVLHIAR